MDVLKFVRERNRMCRSFKNNCYGCPASKDCNCVEWNEKIIPIVEKWSAEHSCKTR